MDENNDNIIVPDTNETRPGAILTYDLSEQMKRSYIDYAMSVIVSRALPDARDGLKPVHRRILYSMWDMGIRYNTANKKCARIVGDVLGKYHPHGYASVYDALVRLAQDFSLRYPVVFPQGNFGSIDGDPPAAMRYTEAKMAKIGEEMMADIGKDTVDFMSNYDESLTEPVVLPAAFPFMICNGSSGIAVGMATNMAPHNLNEVVDAVCAVIDNPEITIPELMDIVKGPDFPTAGTIHGRKGIMDAFSTGKGKVVIRSKYEISEADPHSRDDMNKTHDAIYFTELPYQVNKAELVKKIDDYRKDGIIPGIAQVKDLSGRDGLRVAVYLKNDAVPNVVLNMLWQRTQLQTNFNIYNLALYNGTPKLFNLKDMLTCYIDHREEVIERRTRSDLKQAKEREHVLLGLKIGLENIDEVIRIIKESEDNAVASLELQNTFGLSQIQADAIIDMKLGRLSHLETDKILGELAEIEKRIAEFNYILESRDHVLAVVKEEIKKIGDIYGDERRTRIIEAELDDASPEDFIKKEEVVINITNKGFAKRLSADEYKTIGKGGKGVVGAKLTDGDYVDHLFTCSSHDYITFVTNFGKAYYLKAFEIPESSKNSKGVIMRTFLEMEKDEKITSMITFAPDEMNEETYLLMVTKLGVTKRVRMTDFRNAKKKGVKAIILDEGDELVKTIRVQEHDEIMYITKNGKGLRISMDDVRPMGRATHGVRAMKLIGNDEIVGAVKVSEDHNILLLTELGKGKRVEFSNFTQHSRGTMGQRIYGLNEDDALVGACEVTDNDDVILITRMGQILRIAVNAISTQGKNATGVIIARFKKKNDRINAMDCTFHVDEPEEEEVSEDGATVVEQPAPETTAPEAENAAEVVESSDKQ
ncbi:MAG: DNA topoisomerase (ATP-hydrolyzing) subunit A [Bacteroidales bacterium]|nr:DNA topoisomerase (ATP-hydrolyzing) subunit A [Bacteroidales bacterium]